MKINKQLKIDILDWHITTFQEATLENQVLKWQEECRELQICKNYKMFMEELADCFIVATALCRFGEVGELIQDVFNDCIIFMCDNRQENWDLSQQAIERAIFDKMRINRQRKWAFVNGVYKHQLPSNTYN